VLETTSEMIDRAMPGSYQCTIEQVRVSVVGLVAPFNSVHGSVYKSGLSRLVVGGTAFSEITLRQAPERLALTGTSTDSLVVPLMETDDRGIQRPFQGSGFASQWSLEIPKQNNSFDYRGLATVLVTVVYSALHSETYADQIRQRQDRHVSFEKAYNLRRNFPDAWRDLSNPDFTEVVMRVQLTTSRADLPPNLDDFTLEAVVLYVVRRDGETFEQEIEALTFQPNGTAGEIGGAAETVDGRVSTRAGNGTAWLPMLGSAPAGTWTLTFPDEPQTRQRFADGQIEDVLLILSIGALQ
jgi:hypothetical protein